MLHKCIRLNRVQSYTAHVPKTNSNRTALVHVSATLRQPVQHQVCPTESTQQEVLWPMLPPAGVNMHMHVCLWTLRGRMLVWSLGFAAPWCWGGCRLVPPKKRPVPLQIRRGRHDLQPLSSRLLGVQWGGLQALRLPTQLWHCHRPVFEQVGHYWTSFQWLGNVWRSLT